jgi:site-specific DNA-cytosine methylase
MDDSDLDLTSQNTSPDEASEDCKPVSKARPAHNARAAVKSMAKKKKNIHQGKSQVTHIIPSKPTREDDSDMASQETSISDETARIQRATERWTQLKPGRRRKACADALYDNLAGAGRTSSNSGHQPQSSGLFHFTEYLLTKVFTADEISLLGSRHQGAYTFAELCAGTATATMCSEALRRTAAGTQSIDLQGHCLFYTESSPFKRSAILKVHDNAYAKTRSTCLMFEKTASLSQEPHVKTVDGTIVEVPVPQILFCGIVCKDVSGLSTTPKSVLDRDGKSGSSFLELNDYLKTTKLERRPQIIILECVARLGHKRQIAAKTEKGTEVISLELTERGYIGSWMEVCARVFFLPQMRSRVWGVFLKLHPNGMGDQGKQLRMREVELIMSFVERCKTQGFEPLSTLLQHNIPPPYPEKGRKQKHGGISTAGWMIKHESFKAAQGLVADDFECDSLASVLEKAKLAGLPDREQQALLIRLAMSRKKGQVMDWRDHVIGLSIGASVDRISMPLDCCACLTPFMKFLLVVKGELSLEAIKMNSFALQGIQAKELHAFGLDGFSSNERLALAGDAFTANVCVSFLLSALLVVTPDA